MNPFTTTDLNRHATWAGQPYDATNGSHRAQKDELLDGPVRKTTYWGEQVLAQLKGLDLGYELTKHNQAHDLNKETKAPMFKPYTWASFTKPTAGTENVYFTVGVNQQGHLLVKLDYQRYDQLDRPAERNLSATDRNLLGAFIRERGGTEAEGILIKRTETARYATWPPLVTWAADFISKYDSLYDEAVRAIGTGGLPPAWGQPVPPREVIDQRRKSYLREAQQIDPTDDHYQMSVRLHQQLAALCGAENVAAESPTGYRTRMDLEVRHPGTDRRAIFELKSCTRPEDLRAAIREALGQLLEYAFWPAKPSTIGVLVIATPQPLTDEVKRFVRQFAFPKGENGVPLRYLQVTPQQGAVSTERLEKLLRNFGAIT